MPPKSNKMKYIIGLAVILIIASAGVSGYFYKQLIEIKNNPNKVALDENATTIAAVEKLIVLPQNEQPTIATVSDPSKLKSQPFFAQAKVGDKVLIYSKAKKAILYDPMINKILEVAPLNTDVDAANASDSSQVSGTTTDTAPLPPPPPPRE